MTFGIHEIFEKNGVNDPNHHQEMFAGQMTGFEELRKMVN